MSDLSREAAVAADYTDDLCALLLRESQGLDQVGADIFLDVATADREDEDRVALAQTAAG
jgi:hypothetical protein